MWKLELDGSVSDYRAVLVSTWEAARDEADTVLALPVWREALAAGRTPLPRRVWLAPEEDPLLSPDEGTRLEEIVLPFAKFTDGRAFSQATRLRRRGWHGRLTAFGAFLLDQLDYLRRCGFDGFVPDPARYDRATLERDGARLLTVFPEPYQASAAVPDPLFRRRERGLAEDRTP
ncbi:DUF934 domain-containing protein [Tepidiphilus baoligensis]|uniref:DUF934 domain-containing protein n=1 Tax=Tepidiphilus baoligensis TaxID=2698687 RepID=A0ABX1QNX0_9PROT|nr:DUF934 domain-containing protein [Tepidiphilus baoligensis]NMH16980.1 DUF934 domain-containing protein [Tepidiphilus baoligensis]